MKNLILQITGIIFSLFILNSCTENKDKPNINKIEDKQKEIVSKEKSTELTPLKKGQSLAMKTKATLGKNLMSTIRKSGTDAALDFCNINAYPLVDSMSTYLNASIKRVSDKPRNLNAVANEKEMNFILKAKKALANNEKIKGEVFELNNKMVGYYPILTNKMCLQCHGSAKTQIKESTMNILSRLYPEDKAIGYGENELRGIWVIEFE